ncbi:MAG: hypothetical protein HFJ59_08120 [Clostridia bacterium]|nr:hypothetical protein [Clostridia bacterium]
MDNIVIGVEGLVGSGKTSSCKELLNYVPNSIFLQGGNLYRGIVFALISSGIDLEHLKESIKYTDIKLIMEKLKITLSVEDRDTVIYIDGKKVDEVDLQSAKNSLAVSEICNVADNQSFYLFARNIIQHFKEKYNVIVSGRDLMKIYPDLDYHFFFTASLEERIRKKSLQYEGNIDLLELRENIITRDNLHRSAGFYKKYDKTIVVDVTDCKTVLESTQKVFRYINIKSTCVNKK